MDEVRVTSWARKMAEEQMLNSATIESVCLEQNPDNKLLVSEYLDLPVHWQTKIKAIIKYMAGSKQIVCNQTHFRKAEKINRKYS